MNEATLKNLTDEELIRMVHAEYTINHVIAPLVIELTQRLEQRIGLSPGKKSNFAAKRAQLLKRIETLTAAVNQLETDIEALEAA